MQHAHDASESSHCSQVLALTEESAIYRRGVWCEAWTTVGCGVKREEGLIWCVMTADAFRDPDKVRKRCALILRDTIPLKFTPQPGHDLTAQNLVRAAIRSATFEHNGFHVVMDERTASKIPDMRSLSECGDVKCTCNRQSYPWVREQFKAHVLRAFQGMDRCASHGHSSLHYVSLGAGGCLADLEIICALQDEGHRIRSASFVDTAYTTRDSIQWDALQAMANFLGEETRVDAYDSTLSLAIARFLQFEPPATLLLQIDVSAISREELSLVSALTLEPDGLCFLLDNPSAPEVATVSAWQQTAAGAQVATQFANTDAELPLDGDTALVKAEHLARVFSDQLSELKNEHASAREKTLWKMLHSGKPLRRDHDR